MEEKKELSMEVRLLLAFLLMGIVLFVTPYFYKQPPPQPNSTKTAVQTNTDTAQSTAKTDTGKTLAPPVSAIPPAEIPGQLQAKEEETFAVDTDLYRVTFSNRGATVRSWILKAYKDQASKPVDLVNARALAKVPGAFAVMVKGQPLSPDPNMALFQVQRPDNLTVNFQYSDGRLAVKKSFHFSQKSYLVTVSSEVSQNGAPLPHGLAWRGGFGDSTVVNPANYQQALYYDVGNSKLQELPVKNAKDGPVASAGQYSFAGLEDAYFAGVYLPEGRTSVELTEFEDAIPNAAGTEEQRVGASVGGEGSNVFTFFAGPKDYALLHLINPKLDQLINWGWFEFLAKPLFLALYWTAVHVTSHNYGWAIIALTVGINMLLFPLKLSSMKSSRKMQSDSAAGQRDQRQVQRLVDEGPAPIREADGIDGSVQETRVQSGGRLLAHADPASVFHRILQDAPGDYRTSRREFSVGTLSIAARDVGDSIVADYSGGHAVRYPENDAVSRSGSRPTDDE